MTNDIPEDDRGRVEAVRRALIDAALIAHEDAGLSGLCGEGRWEAAVDAMRTIDLGQATRLPAARQTGLPADRPVANLMAQLPKGTDDSAATRAAAIERAMGPATVVPLEIARAAASVAELAANVAERGNANALAEAQALTEVAGSSAVRAVGVAERTC